MSDANMAILYIVVPCYNEEEVLPETARRLKAKLAELTRQGRISSRSRVLFVNDGSRDRTWEIICALHREDRIFSGVDLSRNTTQHAIEDLLDVDYLVDQEVPAPKYLPD